MPNVKTLIKNNRYRAIQQLPEWLRTPLTYPEQIHELRNLLGMTQAQLAKRAGYDARIVRYLEAGDGDPQLSTLQKTAQGLECDVVIRFVPKQAIPALLKARTQQKAQSMIDLAIGTAAMEGQQPDDQYVQAQKEAIVATLQKKPSLLWDD